MRNSAVTRLAANGRVGIPESIRKFMALKAGTKMMVFTDGVNILFKPIPHPNPGNFKKVAKTTRHSPRKNDKNPNRTP